MPEPLGSFDFTWPYLAAVVLGYLAGSVPFGLVLTKLGGYGDIRKIGSGNIGATNVLRTGNKPLALATLLLDGGKGAVASLVGGLWGPDMMVLAAGASFIGHLFSVWLRFKGGKGVATFLGIMLAVAWPAGFAACLTWFAVALVFRISSASALAATLATPFYMYHWADMQAAQLAGFCALLVWIRHHENIRRLLTGTEPRISFGKKA